VYYNRAFFYIFKPVIQKVMDVFQPGAIGEEEEEEEERLNFVIQLASQYF